LDSGQAINFANLFGSEDFHCENRPKIRFTGGFSWKLLLVLDHFGKIGQQFVDGNKGPGNTPPDNFTVLIDQEVIAARSFGLLVQRAESFDHGRIDIAQERILGTHSVLELLLGGGEIAGNRDNFNF
jgi:hypothetical protein